MADADIIVIGSGHNGLVAAAYLALAGKRVLVLERNAWFGGGVVTRELTRPGFRHDQHSMSHIFIQGNPLLLNDDLGLKRKYGLQYVFPEVPMMSVWEDGSTLPLYRDPAKSAEAIRKFSARDAETFLELSRQAAEWLPMIQAGLYSPPMPVGAQTAMMDQSAEGREIMRTMGMSTFDLMEELFEHDKVKAHFGRVAGENLVSPDEKATGIGAYVFLGFLEKFGFGVPVGGSGSLTSALIACIEDHGGAVRAGAQVREVETDGTRATGVVLDSGERLSCSDGVIGAIHPHHLPEMVPAVSPTVAKNAKRTHITPAACFTVHAALDAPLKFKAGDLSAVMYELMPANYEDMRRAFDELRYGQMSPTPLVGVGQLTQHDPSRAPEGRRSSTRGTTCPTSGPTAAAGMRPRPSSPTRSSRVWRTTSRTCPTWCSTITATVRSTWSAPAPASCAATSTASPPPPTSPAAIARRRSSANTACRGSSGSTSSARSSIRAEGCSAPGGRPRWSWPRTWASSSTG